MFLSFLFLPDFIMIGARGSLTDQFCRAWWCWQTGGSGTTVTVTSTTATWCVIIITSAAAFRCWWWWWWRNVFSHWLVVEPQGCHLVTWHKGMHCLFQSFLLLPSSAVLLACRIIWSTYHRVLYVHQGDSSHTSSLTPFIYPCWSSKYAELSPGFAGHWTMWKAGHWYLLPL